MNDALLLKMGVELSEFQKGLVKAVEDAQRAQEKITQDHKKEVAKRKAEDREAAESKKALTEHASGALESGLAMAGVSLGLEGLAEMAKRTLELGARMKDMSEETGVSAEKIQTLGYAFQQNGASQESFEKGMIKLVEKIGEAKNGSEEAITAFGALGVTWKDLHDLSPDEVLLKISDAGDAAGDTAQRLALYMELLGKSGAKMAAGLNQGADKLRELQGKVSPLTTEDVKTLKEGADAVETLGKKWDIFKAKVLSGAQISWRNLTNPKAEDEDRQKEADENVGDRLAYRGPTKTPGAIVGANEQYGPETAEESEKKESEKRRAELQAAVAKYAGKTPPVFKSDREAIGNAAETGIKGVLAGAKTEQGNSENDAENDARRAEQAKAIKQIQNEADYVHMSAMATIIGQTSKLAQLDQEAALTQRQIADAKAKLATEGDDIKRATIAKEIAGLENKSLETDTKREDLNIKLADAEQEISFALQQQAIDRLKGVSAAGDQLARDKEIELYGQKIAKNLNEMKISDELRTAELKKQNVELQTQQQTLDKANQAKYIADHNKTPAELNKEHAQDHKNESLARAYQRRTQIGSTHGGAQPDVGNRSVKGHQEAPADFSPTYMPSNAAHIFKKNEGSGFYPKTDPSAPDGKGGGFTKADLAEVVTQLAAIATNIKSVGEDV